MLTIWILIGVVSLSVGSGLTSENCATHSWSALFNATFTTLSSVQSHLVPTVFTKVASGYIITVTTEESGENNGGKTNADGSYREYFLNGADVLPDGLCDIPKNTGAARCNATTGNTDSFVLGKSDVIVHYECSPTSVRYFGYDLTIGTRLTEEYPFYPGQNFGDTISNIDVNYAATETNDTPFNQPIVVIHSADLNAAQTVADAIMKYGGISASRISILGIPESIVRLWDRTNNQTWQESAPDILSFIGRYSIPTDKESYLSYQKSYWPVNFYIAGKGSDAYEPYISELNPRYSEKVLNEYTQLNAGLTLLKQNIQTAWSDKSTYKGDLLMNLKSEGFYDDWQVILDKKDNSSFILPTRDATYGIPISNVYQSLQQGSSGVLVGIIHQVALDTAYSSVGLDVLDSKTGKTFATNWFTDYELIGSAKRYLTTNDADNDQDLDYLSNTLFAVDFLPPGGCTTIGLSRDDWCIEFDAKYLPTSEDSQPLAFISLGERIYQVQETKVGPSANTTIPSMFMVFIQ